MATTVTATTASAASTATTTEQQPQPQPQQQPHPQTQAQPQPEQIAIAPQAPQLPPLVKESGSKMPQNCSESIKIQHFSKKFDKNAIQKTSPLVSVF